VRRAPGHADSRAVGDLLAEERLRPLHAMSCGRALGVTSGETPYVWFDLNDYSIPHAYVKSCSR
jgi:hypothetical protein